jgi:Domain of unknown function (DUF4157)
MQLARAQSAEARRQSLAGAEKAVEPRAAARSTTGIRPSRSLLPGAGERLGSGGRALDDAARSRLETRVGHELSGVRVHDDVAAAASARALGARAFALGGDIFFGAGEYRLGTHEGRRLLAHEVAHVVHARSVPVLPGIGPPDSRAERGAAAFARTFAAARRVAPLTHDVRSWGPAWQLQRQPAKSSSPPPHVSEFEDILKKTLFPKDPVIKKVKVEDLTPKIHFPGLYAAGYGAWTNAATKIFVRDPQSLRDPKDPALTKSDVRDFLVITAFHEAVHLRQFAKAKDRPRSYAQMMQYEAEAYEATAAWLDSKEGKQLVKSADTRDRERKQSTIIAKAFRAELARVKGLKDSNDQLKTFLLGKNKIGADLQDAGLPSDDSDSDGEAMLPPHKDLDELYGK